MFLFNRRIWSIASTFVLGKSICTFWTTKILRFLNFYFLFPLWWFFFDLLYFIIFVIRKSVLDMASGSSQFMFHSTRSKNKRVVQNINKSKLRMQPCAQFFNFLSRCVCVLSFLWFCCRSKVSFWGCYILSIG